MYNMIHMGHYNGGKAISMLSSSEINKYEKHGRVQIPPRPPVAAPLASIGGRDNQL